ncbi:MAG: hypothetical protein Q9170_007545, partial [Blastenia crenularia]
KARTRLEEAETTAEAAETRESVATTRANKHRRLLDIFEDDELEEEGRDALRTACDLAAGYKKEAEQASEDTKEARREAELAGGVCEQMEEEIDGLKEQAEESGKDLQRCVSSAAVVMDFIHVIREATSGPQFKGKSV